MSESISSNSNPKIKYVRRLQSDGRFRRKEGVLVVEGTRWISELVDAQIRPSVLLCTADWLADHQKLLEEWGERPLTITPELMQEISDTQTPAGVLAVIDQPQNRWPEQPTFLLLLDGLRDPGNLGTLLRTAAAAGVEGVILAPGCVDPFNPKVVRSTMGALLRLPIWRAGWAEIEGLTAATRLYLAAGEGDTLYTAVDWTQPATLIIGGEADGAGSHARELAHNLIAIPMARNTESLNAAVAGSVILFEAVRQKKLRETESEV